MPLLCCFQSPCRTLHVILLYTTTTSIKIKHPKLCFRVSLLRSLAKPCCCLLIIVLHAKANIIQHTQIFLCDPHSLALAALVYNAAACS